MSKFTHLIFSLALLIGLSVGAAAQKQPDPKKPPPKDPKNPPVINPRDDKKPPKEEKPKKPDSGFAVVWLNKEDYSA